MAGIVIEAVQEAAKTKHQEPAAMSTSINGSPDHNLTYARRLLTEFPLIGILPFPP